MEENEESTGGWTLPEKGLTVEEQNLAHTENTKNTQRSSSETMDTEDKEDVTSHYCHVRQHKDRPFSRWSKRPPGSGDKPFLKLMAMLVFLQGLFFFGASFLDNSLHVLPRDPLTLLGTVYLFMGFVFLLIGRITRRCHFAHQNGQTNETDAERSGDKFSSAWSEGKTSSIVNDSGSDETKKEK